MMINPLAPRPASVFTRNALAAAVAIVAAAPAFAQNTTAAAGGFVTGTDGKPTSGATVTLRHLDSGSSATTTTASDGSYLLRGLRVGGPYTLTVSKAGVTERRENLFLTLAESLKLDLVLGAPATTTIVVTGQAASERFNPATMGTALNVSSRELQTYASVQRNLQDYARLDARVTQTDKDRGEISVVGQNSRFNSITIDSVTVNDTFGLEANNLPMLKQPVSIDAIQSVQVNVANFDTTLKAFTGANINAVTKSGTNSVKGSAYYVFRDNELAGKRYNRTNGSYFKPAPFEEITKGFTLGGPLVPDRLFFFVNYEELGSTREVPVFGPLGGTLTNVGITRSAIAGAQSIARNTWGIDIGSSDIPEGTKLQVRDRLLKLDWNVSDRHRANLRYTKTDQGEPNFRNFNNRSLSLNSNWDTQVKSLETTVGQWFADWTDAFSTEFKYSRRRYSSIFNTNSDLPQVTLSFTGPLPEGTPASVATGTRSLLFGTDRFRHFNVLRTDTHDAYLGGNWSLGAHEVKGGFDLSANRIYNAFFQDTRGVYTFGCVNSSATFTYSFGAINCSATTTTAAQIEAAVLENFQRGRPSNYVVQVSADGRPLAEVAANWTLGNQGLFLQDTWRLNKDLSVMFGLRVDKQSTNDRPKANAQVVLPKVAGSFNQTTGALTRETGGFGLDNTETLDGEDLIQPRLGFNWALPGERRMQLRGGVGLFQGASANVWLTNPFTNPGVTIRNISCSGATCGNTTIFSPNPATQPTNFPGASPTQNVDMVAPNTAQPAVWKFNLAFDAEIPGTRLVAGAEYLYTKAEAALHYAHLNLGAPTRSGKDGRELYWTAQGYDANCWSATGSSSTAGSCNGLRVRALSNAGFNDVVLASKTSLGHADTLTLSVTQPTRSGFGWSVALARSTAKEVNPLTSSRAISNWTARSAFNPNEEVLANSQYLVKDRVIANANWSRAFFGSYRTTLGLFYEGKRGKPYSWTYINDLNGDGQGGNDLMYIPSAPGSGEVVFRGDTAPNGPNEQAFWAIVDQFKELRNSKGRTVQRNGSFAPFVNSFDLRLSQEVPGLFAGHKGTLSLDILNFANLLNKRWGRIDEIVFVTASGGFSRSFVNYAGLDAQGRYIYAMGNVEDFITKQNRGESQWAAQVTLRYEF